MKPKDKFILIVIFPVVCLNCKSHEIQRIDVKCVDIRIETPFRITCEKFEDFFQEDIDIISIEDQDRIAVFSRIIKELKEADQSKCPLPDTRIKIEIIHKDKKTIMCIDHLVMSISDNLYLTSNAMLEFIEETIKSKSEKEGNNRVVVNQAGAVQQVNHYYAFGGLFGEGAQTVSQRYRYNGKELDTKIGLNMYDYGARHYDAALGRWFTVDRTTERAELSVLARSWTPR